MSERKKQSSLADALEYVLNDFVFQETQDGEFEVASWNRPRIEKIREHIGLLRSVDGATPHSDLEQLTRMIYAASVATGHLGAAPLISSSSPAPRSAGSSARRSKRWHGRS